MGRIVRYSKSKPDDSLYVRGEHTMGGSGLMASCRFLRGWKRKATQDYESSSGVCEAASDTRDMPKDIATQMAGILAWLE